MGGGGASAQQGAPGNELNRCVSGPNPSGTELSGKLIHYSTGFKRHSYTGRL